MKTCNPCSHCKTGSLTISFDELGQPDGKYVCLQCGQRFPVVKPKPICLQLKTLCPACQEKIRVIRRRYNNIYYWAHREKLLKKQREYNAANPDKNKAWKRTYQQKCKQAQVQLTPKYKKPKRKLKANSVEERKEHRRLYLREYARQRYHDKVKPRKLERKVNALRDYDAPVS